MCKQCFLNERGRPDFEVGDKVENPDGEEAFVTGVVSVRHNLEGPMYHYFLDWGTTPYVREDLSHV